MATIQIRNMPDHVHRIYKARAAEAGMTLSAYLLEEIKKIAAVPTEEEMRERARELWRRTPKE
jgi:plasmid stability protein